MAEQPKTVNTGLIVVVMLLAVFLCLVFSNNDSNKEPAPTSTPQEAVWYSCTLFVEQQLDVDSSDAQRFSSERVTSLGSNQYAVEIYYASVPATYRCEIERLANGDSKLLALSVK